MQVPVQVQVRKGAEDARMKMEASVNGVQVSNHALGFAGQSFFFVP